MVFSLIPSCVLLAFGKTNLTSKTFDRVNHSLLFRKLIKNEINLSVLRLLQFWYNNQRMIVEWGECVLQSFGVTNGGRQGGVLNPFLFSLCMFELSIRQSDVKLGFFVANIPVNHLLHADDLCCFSPSLDGLQDLLNVYSHYAVEHGMVIINDKSEGMLFRVKRFASPCMPNRRIGDKVIRFSSSVKYLGVCVNDTITDNKDIKRQMKYLYVTAHWLKTNFVKCSKRVKNFMFKQYLLSCSKRVKKFRVLNSIVQRCTTFSTVV